MKKINVLFTLTSINVVLVTLERFSPTTKVLLQPYDFMRLHEILQMSTLILFTVLIPFLLLRLVSDNFRLLQTKVGFYLVMLFVIGVYFYATGNGIHEVSSYNFNQFCDTKVVSGQPCGSMFFNDYYTGNIYYFVGAVLMTVPLLLLESHNPSKKAWDTKEMSILAANAAVYALAIFAYAAFDRVLIGLVYSLIMTGIALWFFWKHRAKYKLYPVITYTALTYTLGTVAAVVVKIIR